MRRAAQVGRRVITSLRGTGCYAERAVPPAGALIDVPVPSLRQVLAAHGGSFDAYRGRLRIESSIIGSIPTAYWSSCKSRICGAFAEPSDGLEPPTPSL